MNERPALPSIRSLDQPFIHPTDCSGRRRLCDLPAPTTPDLPLLDTIHHPRAHPSPASSITPTFPESTDSFSLPHN
ncbi:hypothetical protein NMY22_g6648 [Coprinellus aureogranulatus]|nr:hypothetical protein NMY22_g6648 [Coprinellus aureogranulatus]